MAASRVALILGSGANIGAGVARALAGKGYKIAVTSRSAPSSSSTNNTDADLHIQGDLSDPNAVAGIFQKVVSSLGPPSVVVYNAAAATMNPPENPVALSPEDLNRDLQVNTTSVLAAARESVAAFEKLPPSQTSPAFIYTGNFLNHGGASANHPAIVPVLLSLGVGKSATAHMIALLSKAYAGKGYRFYYADERKADGSAAMREISGPAHGEFYAQLAANESSAPWLATFVKDKGYVDFSSK